MNNVTAIDDYRGDTKRYAVNRVAEVGETRQNCYSH